GDKPLKMDGAVNVTMDVKTTGESLNQLKKASTGQIVLNMKETQVDGFDPEFYMRSSIADYVHSKGFGVSKTIMGSYKPRDVTVFDTIHSTVKLSNGKASTNDFLMDSKRVQIRADGFADIMQDRLDVTSSIKLPRGKTVTERILDSPVYVRIHGPFDALQYDLDKGRLKKSTTDLLEKEAKEKAREKVDKEMKKTEDKLKNKLRDKLKSLF
ncbi:MAG: AsmA family protein, partial [Gammaproteobacteria bacterium]|nr:AsmA family protein [Gammaproteobacteria bacterium]